MTREVLVAVHAGAGITGLIVGLAVFHPPTTSGGSPRLWRIAYGSMLAILLFSLLALIAIDWRGLQTSARLAFVGLAGLAGVMVSRMYMAHRLVSDDNREWRHHYVSHVYFTYISLCVGFVIVPALRSNTPALWIPIAVAIVLVTGTILLRLYEQRIGIRPTS